MGRTYRMYISGGISDRHFQTIIGGDLIDFLTSEVEEWSTTVVRNPFRSSNSAQMDIDIPSPPIDYGDTEEAWFGFALDAIEGFIDDHRIDFEDITN